MSTPTCYRHHLLLDPSGGCFWLARVAAWRIRQVARGDRSEREGFGGLRSTARESQPVVLRRAVAVAVVMAFVAGLSIESGCTPPGDPISRAFRRYHPHVDYRNGELIKLSFGVAGFSNQDLRKIKEMVSLDSLEELDLSETSITDAALVYIRDCKNLKMLALDYTLITDVGLAHLGALSSLRQLNLAGTYISDRGLSQIEHLDNLEFLVLMETRISDEGAKHLEKLQNLQVLYLNGTRLGDRGAQSIGKLHKLRTLYLNGTPLSDSGVAHLATLRNLDLLDLSETQVGDRGLASLQSLTNLRVLDLSGTQVTRHGVEQLQAVLPKTTIFWASTPARS